MQIHLVQNSTSARFEKNIHLKCEFIQQVQPVIHLVLNIHLEQIYRSF